MTTHRRRSFREAVGRRLRFPETVVGEEPPLRAELFSREQMAQHGRVLATSHRLSPSRGSDELLARLEGNEALPSAPCLPGNWASFTVHYRFRETVYHIVVRQTARATGDERVEVDGRLEAAMAVPLVDDRCEHRVEVWVRAT